VVELFGLSRLLAQEQEIELELRPEGTLRDLVLALGQRAPALNGRVLTQDGKALLPPYVLVLNGQSFLEDLDLQPQEGDRILLMAPPAGG
jgi:molybdopterin converting factor small subunit